jgi:hypothetical protein
MALQTKTAARQWFSYGHMVTQTDTKATTEELLDGVFSMRFVLRLYNEDQLTLVSRERVCRQVAT